MSLLKAIKTISVGVAEAGDPVAVLFATITQTSPIEVNVDQRLILGSDFLIMLDHVRDLRKGDAVVLLRVQNGQSFVVLGKAADV
ncbi:DUF2577 domain-containing protein [Paenibacillus chitinolyticus]